MSPVEINTEEIHRGATLLGVLAVVFWGSTIALSRRLTEDLGPITATSYIFLLGGVCAMLSRLLSTRSRSRGPRLPLSYWLGCGGLFVVNQMALYLAVGFAAGRRQAIEVGLINYLWPSLTILFSLPLLGRKGKWPLMPGIACAAAGVALALWPGSANIPASDGPSNLLPCLLAFVAAVTWGIFSNLSRKLARDSDGNAIPIFLLATGLAMTGLRLFFPEHSSWSLPAVFELIAAALFPTWLAFQFWDIAMRRGNMILVASLSYFIPLISVIISSIYLRVAPGSRLWAACALVIAGAIICNYSIAGTRRASGGKMSK